MNSISGTSIKERREHYALALESALDSIVAQLSQIPEVEKVILFGSYLDGRRDLFTDLDLLVVMDTEESFVTRTVGLYSKVQTDVDLDLIVYTPEELEANRENRFIRRALQTGQVIYEKKRT